MPAVTIEVTPDVLRWARGIAGLSYEDAAKRLKLIPDELRQIEAGRRVPTLLQLRRMATVYGLPLSTLLMPEPLDVPEPPLDMRTVGGQATRLSPETLRLIREVRERQELADDLATEAPELARTVELPRATISDDPESLGAAERERLGISVDAQLAWKDPAEAFQRWRLAVEGQGIFVFVQPMPREDARGFCLVNHGGPPAIVVNSHESDQAKSFTIFHEYGHVLLRAAALCLELPNGDRAQSERFCNQFAAGFLMPDAAVAVALPQLARQEGDLPLGALEQAARKLKVSRPALALRLEEMGAADRGYFERVLGELKSETWEDRERKGGPAYAVSVVAQLGTAYTSLVLRALDAGVIDRNTASEMLNAPARQFGSIASRVSEHAERYAARI